MKHLELEEKLENIGLSFEIKDNIGRRWNISPVLLVKGVEKQLEKNYLK